MRQPQFRGLLLAQLQLLAFWDGVLVWDGHSTGLWQFWVQNVGIEDVISYVQMTLDVY